jgi:hypothetical protein
VELNEGLGTPDLQPVTLTSDDPDEIDNVVNGFS